MTNKKRANTWISFFIEQCWGNDSIVIAHCDNWIEDKSLHKLRFQCNYHFVGFLICFFLNSYSNQCVSLHTLNRRIVCMTTGVTFFFLFIFALLFLLIFFFKFQSLNHCRFYSLDIHWNICQILATRMTFPNWYAFSSKEIKCMYVPLVVWWTGDLECILSQQQNNQKINKLRCKLNTSICDRNQRRKYYIISVTWKYEKFRFFCPSNIYSLLCIRTYFLSLDFAFALNIKKRRNWWWCRIHLFNYSLRRNHIYVFKLFRK